MQPIIDVLVNVWRVTLEAAPWLLFGLLAAGVIKAWVPQQWIARAMGGKGFGSVVRAAVVGIPLPLCSCGVLPTAIGLRRQGASRSATAAFLISTPEIGLDSFALSYALLGPFMAIARPIASLTSALITGAMVAFVEPFVPEPNPTDDADGKAADSGASCCSGSAKKATPEASSCCSSAQAEPQPKASCCSANSKPAEQAQSNSSCCSEETEPAPASSCCSTASAPANAAPGAMAKLGGGMMYVMTNLLDDIKVWLAIAVIVAGVVYTIFPEPAAALQQWGSGPSAKLVMLVVGIPLYVCATASTPIAAGLLVAGVSPGTVLVLLLAGPATNIGSLAVLKKELGTPIVATYLAGVAITSLLCGIALDAVAQHYDVQIKQQLEHVHDIVPAWLAWTAAFILIFFAIKPLRQLVIRPAKTATAKSDGGSSCCSE